MTDSTSQCYETFFSLTLIKTHAKLERWGLPG